MLYCVQFWCNHTLKCIPCQAIRKCTKKYIVYIFNLKKKSPACISERPLKLHVLIISTAHIRLSGTVVSCDTLLFVEVLGSYLWCNEPKISVHPCLFVGCMLTLTFAFVKIGFCVQNSTFSSIRIISHIIFVKTWHTICVRCIVLRL